MNFTFLHSNINVFDLEKSIAFYEKALDLKVVRQKEKENAFKLVYLADEHSIYQLELTWLADRTTPYNLGDNEIHIAFCVEDYEKAHNLHKEMGVICYENTEMGLYFISDPDGYWLEILPAKKI